MADMHEVFDYNAWVKNATVASHHHHHHRAPRKTEGSLQNPFSRISFYKGTMTELLFTPLKRTDAEGYPLALVKDRVHRRTELMPSVIERHQLQITPKLLGMNIPLSRARVSARSETRLEGDVATEIFRMCERPQWFAYSSIKIRTRYKDVAAVYFVSDPNLTDDEVREFIQDDMKTLRMESDPSGA
jgi:hypothetical protein